MKQSSKLAISKETLVKLSQDLTAEVLGGFDTPTVRVEASCQGPYTAFGPNCRKIN